MKKPGQISVIDLFPEILDQLLELLTSLPIEAWEAPTSCSGWTVKDVALHLLGDDVGMLSRGRDGYAYINKRLDTWGQLVDFINELNDMWLQGSRRMSPRLISDLLRFTGEQVNAYFRSLDPKATGNAVAWAGPKPAPVWLDLAREYTERWHHQQHIRDAVGIPGLKVPRYLAPVLDTFVRALPFSFRDVDAEQGTLIALTIQGLAGGRWYLRQEGGKWELYEEVEGNVDSEVAIEDENAWRLFTRGLTVEEATSRVMITGDEALGRRVLDAVAIIA